MRKKPTLYSLFQLKDGEWVRVSKISLPQPQAAQHWQDHLLDFALGSGKRFELRPVKDKLTVMHLEAAGVEFDDWM